MPDIMHQFKVNAPIEKVFAGFTEPTHLNAWWPLESDGVAEQDALYRFYFGPGYDWKAQVIHCVPGRELSWKFVETMEDWKPTQLRFVLSESNGGTLVQFSHCDWEEASDHFAISNYCWGQLLNGLKDYLETGTVIPFEKRS